MNIYNRHTDVKWIKSYEIRYTKGRILFDINFAYTVSIVETFSYMLLNYIFDMRKKEKKEKIQF